MSNDFLQGVRVLDLSQYVPGPFATLTLGDYGAEVIKVEPPFGDPMKTAFYVGDDGVSPLYDHLNAGKTIVKVDLKSEEGKAQFRELIDTADVVLESFRSGAMARLGFDYETLKSIKPSLIYCALSGYGQSGPLNHHSGHDLTYVALTGAMSQSGHAEHGPAPIFPPFSDHSGAMQAVSAILAALYRRERTKEGAYIDVSMFEACLSWNYFSLIPAIQNGVEEECGRGVLTGGAAWYNVYECQDGRYLTFAPIEPKFWKNFCVAVEREDLISRHQEPLPQDDLIATLKELFLSQPLSYWDDLLTFADCCMEPVRTLNEVANLPHVTAREVFVNGEMRYPGWIDHKAPQKRQALQEKNIEEILADK